MAGLLEQAQDAQQAGRLDEAERLYREAVAAASGLEARFGLANLLLAQRRPEEALAEYDRLLAERADVPAAWNNRGTALRQLSRLPEAFESYERAIALMPDHVNALTNRAMALWDMKRPQEALVAAEQALRVKPDFAEAWYLRGNALRDLGRIKEALQSFEQALTLNPHHPHALNGAAQAALLLCDWERTGKIAAVLPGHIASGRSVIQPFVLLGYSEDAALQRRCAEAFIARVAPPRPPLWTGQRYAHDKIRLAYLSADFHQHATAVLMSELFERHDRTRFEISAYAFGPDDGSPMRARLEKSFDHFHDVRGRSDREIAQMVKDAETDIAVDLNGHTLDSRPGIFRWRPAPVQVNYLVYPGTTGVPEMDYVLGDRICLPADQQVHFSETIAHLPDCYQANDATRVIGQVPTRAEAGLPETGFVFCCFNNNWKITAPVFGLWMRLLHQVPGSVLWLLDSPATANLQKAAQTQGMDPARLVFAPRAEPAAHLARHRLADLFLDTLPYNAHTSASDALWAGLPLLTCRGAAMPGRVAASLLTFTGMETLITETPQAYEARALELARDPAQLTALRQQLADNRKTAPLFDSKRFVSGIEAAFAAMVR